jgi:hypothetical protein
LVGLLHLTVKGARLISRITLTLAALLLTAAAHAQNDEPIRLVESVRGQHPRLLFDREELDQLRAFMRTPRGRAIAREFADYLKTSHKPGHTNFLRDATDGQRQGFWRLPTVALHAALTGNETSTRNTIAFMDFLLKQEHWEAGKEIDSGMSAANIMIGAALAYDWLYHELDPDFRQRFRAKLLKQALRMYQLGHLEGADAIAYWQKDPQNNHRWHRDAGLALAVLAAADPDRDDDDWLLARVKDELDFVAHWLPEDGTSHESVGYLIFGGSHLLLAMTAGDRCLGTDHLRKPFFQNVNRFMTQSLTPGLDQRFAFGDQGGTGLGAMGYGVFQLQTAGRHDQSLDLLVLNHLLDRHGVGSAHAWLGLLWYPRDLEPGSIHDLPTRDFFPDLGLLVVRDTFARRGNGAMFKCGPLGGYTLNHYRAANDFSYINVAHDDPDANSFVLFADGKFIAETDRYAKRKQSGSHNTILINGVGQAAVGRPGVQGWTQPARGRVSMHDTAVITAMARQGKHVALEGEAGGAYPTGTTKPERPKLERYRRAFLWVEDRYVLVLDDIRLAENAEVAWLMQGPRLEAEARGGGRYRLCRDRVTRDFQVVSTNNVAAVIDESPAESRGNRLGWQQLRLVTKTEAVRFASVYDLWEREGLSVTLVPDGPNRATVRVTGDGIDDTWDWRAAPGRFDPSRIVGKTSEGEPILTLSEPEPETRALIERIEKALR